MSGWRHWLAAVGLRPHVRNSAGERVPAPGSVRFGDFARFTPVSRLFGEDRGRPVDRVYIERFLEQNSADIRGRVLEIAENTYTRRFGGTAVTQSDMLHVRGNGPGVIVGDLTTGQGVPVGAYDCLIITQTFHVIYDMPAAIRVARSALRTGGVLLATLPGISQVARHDMEMWGDFWRVTDAAARGLFGGVFGADSVTVTAHGNVHTSCAFLHGLAAHELDPAAYTVDDADFPLVVTVRAVRREDSA